MNEKGKRLVKVSTENKKAHQTGLQCCQLLSMVFNYQSSISGIQLVYNDMVGKSQIIQQHEL